MGIAYWAWAVFFTLLFTGLNVQGIKMSARFNALLAVGMGIVVAHVLRRRDSLHRRTTRTTARGSSRSPFYDPQTWALPGDNERDLAGGARVSRF